MYLKLAIFFYSKQLYPFRKKIQFWVTLKGFLCYFINQAESRKRAVSTVINFYFQNFYFYFREQKKRNDCSYCNNEKMGFNFFEATFLVLLSNFLLLLFRFCATVIICTENGIFPKFVPYFRDATSCKIPHWRSSQPQEVSKDEYFHMQNFFTKY